MRTLVCGSTLFCVAFALQLIVWKVRLPKRQTRALLIIFFAVLAAGLLFLWAAPVGAAGPVRPPEYLHIAIFDVSLTLAYMITYSAIEADSPSLVMVNAIMEAGPEGFDDRLFMRMMDDDMLIKPRVRDLLTDRMAYLEGGRYRLTRKGVLLARLFIFYRGMLRAPKGG